MNQGTQLSWRIEDQLQLLVESVKDYAIFMLDVEGNVTTWNQGAELIKGYKAEEVRGRHFSIFYTPEEMEQGKPANDCASRLPRGGSKRKAGVCGRTARVFGPT